MEPKHRPVNCSCNDAALTAAKQALAANGRLAAALVAGAGASAAAALPALPVQSAKSLA